MCVLARRKKSSADLTFLVLVTTASSWFMYLTATLHVLIINYLNYFVRKILKLVTLFFGRGERLGGVWQLDSVLQHSRLKRNQLLQVLLVLGLFEPACMVAIEHR